MVFSNLTLCSIWERFRQTLREHGLGMKTIVQAYTEKQWFEADLSADNLPTAVDRRAGSERAKSARTTENETMKTRN